MLKDKMLSVNVPLPPAVKLQNSAVSSKDQLSFTNIAKTDFDLMSWEQD